MCCFLSYDVLGTWSAGRSFEEGSCNGTQEGWLGYQRFKATGTKLPEKGTILEFGPLEATQQRIVYPFPMISYFNSFEKI